MGYGHKQCNVVNTIYNSMSTLFWNWEASRCAIGLSYWIDMKK